MEPTTVATGAGFRLDRWLRDHFYAGRIDDWMPMILDSEAEARAAAVAPLLEALREVNWAVASHVVVRARGDDRLYEVKLHERTVAKIEALVKAAAPPPRPSCEPEPGGLDVERLASALNDAQIKPEELRLGHDLRIPAARLLAKLTPERPAGEAVKPCPDCGVSGPHTTLYHDEIPDHRAAGGEVMEPITAALRNAVLEAITRSDDYHVLDGVLEAALAEARVAAGHRVSEDHDCFLMNCARLGDEVRRMGAAYVELQRLHVALGDEIADRVSEARAAAIAPYVEALRGAIEVLEKTGWPSMDFRAEVFALLSALPLRPSGEPEPGGLDVERRAVVAAARRFLAAHDSMIGSGGVTRDDAFVTKNRADELRDVLRLYDENAAVYSATPERPAEEGKAK